MQMHYGSKEKCVGYCSSFFLTDICDPSWRSTRDGLIGSAFVVSIVAYGFAAAAVWVHVYYHNGEKIKILFSIKWEHF